MVVLTHNGRAHRDEFLSVCILLAVNPTVSRIVRHEPSKEELLSKEVFVVDTGQEYSPETLNFDHHQMESKWDEPVCSLTLILRHFGLEAQARNVFPWLRPTEAGDVFGLAGTAAAAGIDKNVDIRPLLSPVEKAILERFSAVDELTPEHPMFDEMKSIGDALMSELRTVSHRLEALKHRTQLLEFSGHLALLNKIARDQDPELGFNLFIEREHPEALVAIVEDQRGRGWKLFRRRPEVLDLRRIAESPDVGFAHSGGFLATTRALLPADQLVGLLDAAIAPPVAKAA